MNRNLNMNINLSPPPTPSSSNNNNNMARFRGYQQYRLYSPYSLQISGVSFVYQPQQQQENLHQQQQQQPPQSESQPQKWTCEFCLKVLTTKSRLENHVRMHSAKQAVCEICSIVCRSIRGLNVHKRLCHSPRLSVIRNRPAQVSGRNSSSAQNSCQRFIQEPNLNLAPVSSRPSSSSSSLTSSFSSSSPPEISEPGRLPHKFQTNM